MPSPSELRERLENQEEDLNRLTQEIENRIDEYKDWKSIVKRHPFKAMGVAVGAGLILSGSGMPIVMLAAAQLRLTAADSVTAYIRRQAKVLLDV